MNIAESLNNILDIIENKCTDAAGDIHINPDNLEVFSRETDYLKGRMGLEPFQAVVFAAIIASHSNGRCTVNIIGKRMGMSYLRMLSFSKDLFALRDSGLIRLKGTDDIIVPAEVIGSIMNDKPFEKPQLKGLDTRKLLRLRSGIACLFYGAPGTGKTETVYQIARRTGRSILEADVAKLRNCFVGETEKNVRALFHDYRIACSENDRMPILLFNEADAILGTRMEGAVRSTDRMENSVQNILLQEMENFEGILIATTNLHGNLDPAFERRFLFKTRFDLPGVEPRLKIWQAQFPGISDEEAANLAREFTLSGGQIENVARKMAIGSVLTGSGQSVEQLQQYCREELIPKAAGRKIGFQF